jgi:hypothetical protein
MNDRHELFISAHDAEGFAASLVSSAIPNGRKLSARILDTLRSPGPLREAA